jgi:quaternary ammonium compound-resistance protein SugE
MDWIALFIAGLFEIGWPLGLKYGYSNNTFHWPWIGFAVVCIGLSGALLFYAQRTLPIGTSYAIWTGIGTTGTFIVGIFVFGDSASALRLVSLAFIIVGMIGLKLAA